MQRNQSFSRPISLPLRETGWSRRITTAQPKAKTYGH